MCGKLDSVSGKASAQSRRLLSDLRRRARRAPRMRPGRLNIDGLDVQYTDLLSLYMEYKDIFVNRIYHFRAARPDPRIIDGGGCIGMSVLYIRRVYPQARVTCFEPDEALLPVLHRNLTANGCPDVLVVPAGLGPTEGSVAFRPDGSDGGRILEGAAEPGGGECTIRTVCLSEYLREPVDFLKLNIEGQELAVLREVEAAGRLGAVDQLVLEYHGWPDQPQGLGAILELLAKWGFRYLVHDFDAETGPTSKPPFRLGGPSPWFCLVYARRQEGSVTDGRGCC